MCASVLGLVWVIAASTGRGDGVRCQERAREDGGRVEGLLATGDERSAAGERGSRSADGATGVM